MDGKLAVEGSSAEFNINPGTAYRNLKLSVGQSSYWYPFNGSMDDIRVYNRSISATEAKALYEEVFPSVKPFSLISSTPTHSSTGVATNPLIALNFSKPLDQATVPGNIVLRKTGGDIVNTQALDYSGSVIRFYPTILLDKNTSYTVELKTGLKDTDGNALGNDFFFSFTTENPLASPTILKQEIQSPGLEKQKVNQGEKI